LTSDSYSIPGDARRSLLVYNLFFPFVFAALLPGYLLRMLRRGGFREKFGQRLGRYHGNAQERFANGRWIWIHSISVGETLVALKLARALRTKDPSVQVVLSVTTSTGFALAGEHPESWLEIVYNPIDLAPIVRHALDVIRPCQLIFVEGEMWPNLIAECRRRGVPIALVDARLSPHSESRFARFRAWTSPIFRLLDLICVPDFSDVARWQALDVDPKRIYHTGRIKFDETQPGQSTRADEFRALLRQIGVRPETPIVLGGSTWAPEEKILAELTDVARRDTPDLLLILVPRHVERTAEILRELAPLRLRIVRRSELAPPFSSDDHSPPPSLMCDILLVDTTGELRQWYELATVVFVGKSLVATGGQNPAEPAFLGKPVVIGPHMENFAALVRQLRVSDAVVQVEDGVALAKEIRALLADHDRRSALGRRARESLQVHQGATARVAGLLLDLSGCT
jgi:3-deoxy-D-manno-octulosonic-acid transferase